jgi:hypothetical protein
MIRQKISVKDFNKIAKENEYFLWHFLQKEQESSALTMWSIFKEKNEYHKQDNVLLSILDKINIPYFESYAQDSIDFLMDMGLDGKLLWNPIKLENFYIPPQQYFQPIIIGFKKNKIMASTLEKEFCYCTTGIVDLIGKLNIEFLLNSELN